jgi:hypothetical protein
LDLHKHLAAAKNPNDKTRLQREIDATGRQIDQLVYELYQLERIRGRESLFGPAAINPERKTRLRENSRVGLKKEVNGQIKPKIRHSLSSENPCDLRDTQASRRKEIAELIAKLYLVG